MWRSDLTSSWSQSTERAFDLRRAWRAVLRDTAGAAPHADRSACSAPIGDVDILVLSLLLDLTEADLLVCPADHLRGLLGETFRAVSSPTRVVAAPGDGRHLSLLSLAEVAQPQGDTGTCQACVVYGLGGLLPLGAVPADRRSAFHLLSAASPALWCCGLAVAAPDEASAEALFHGLGRAMRGEWIDPLALYEKVQQLSARLRQLGASVESAGPTAEDDRLARLEFEVASLKQSALLRQHVLLAEAAQRASSVP
jgi:hypothetical protein